MATYEIQDYIKLLCIRVDHFESHIVDEKNTRDENDIDTFVERYGNRDGLKIIMIQMHNEDESMEMITLDDVKRFIKNVHVFDYIRHLISDGNKMIVDSDVGVLNWKRTVKYMLN